MKTRSRLLALYTMVLGATLSASPIQAGPGDCKTVDLGCSAVCSPESDCVPIEGCVLTSSVCANGYCYGSVNRLCHYNAP